MPARLLRGRVRTSTVLLTLVFLVAFVMYLLVRPVPATVAGTSPPSTAGPTGAGRCGGTRYAGDAGRERAAHLIVRLPALAGSACDAPCPGRPCLSGSSPVGARQARWFRAGRLSW
jgi:hypothetical protein